MFGLFSKKKTVAASKEKYIKDNIQDIYSRRKEILESFLQELESGKFSFLKEVYCGIAFNQNNENYINRAGKCITEMFNRINCIQKIQLSENFREYTSMEWYEDWSKFDPSELKSKCSDIENYVNILILGSFHPNGFYREKCIILLQQYEQALPFIILRLNDWVIPVRISAYKIVSIMLETCKAEMLFALTPYLEKLNRSRRFNKTEYDKFILQYNNRINLEVTEYTISQFLCKYDFYARKCLYLFLFKKGMSSQLIIAFMNNERNKYLKSYLTGKYIENYFVKIDELYDFIKSKNNTIRYVAVQAVYRQNNNIWDGIENLLLDKSRVIRELTVFIIRKHSDFDIPEFYRLHLDDDSITSVLGLGETGVKSDVEQVKLYLNSDNSKLVSSALISLSNLAGSEYSETYWNYLFDERISVSKTAYLMIRKNNEKYSAQRVYKAFTEIKNINIKRYLVLILINENSWERIPYLLKLYNYGDIGLNYRIHLALERRNPYENVSLQLAEKIKSVIEEEKDSLPRNLINTIIIELKRFEKL